MKQILAKLAGLAFLPLEEERAGRTKAPSRHRINAHQRDQKKRERGANRSTERVREWRQQDYWAEKLERHVALCRTCVGTERGQTCAGIAGTVRDLEESLVEFPRPVQHPLYPLRGRRARRVA